MNGSLLGYPDSRLHRFPAGNAPHRVMKSEFRLLIGSEETREGVLGAV